MAAQCPPSPEQAGRELNYTTLYYNMRVTGAFKVPLDRQIMERIQIQNFKGPVLMNRRSEMGGVRVERMQYRRWGGE